VFSVGSASRLYNEKFQKEQLSEIERVQLKNNSFERVIVKNWVEFWIWQSKVTEKKWHERNQAV
jgi:hypothetical protein